MMTGVKGREYSRMVTSGVLWKVKNIRSGRVGESRHFLDSCMSSLIFDTSRRKKTSIFVHLNEVL